MSVSSSAADTGLHQILEIRHVTKRFGDVVALSDVSLEIRAGEVVGIVGENGAGKSSLVNLLSGSYRADEGEVLWHGAPVRWVGPQDAMRAGVGVVHQEQSLLPNLTVAENVLLANEGDASRFGVYRRARLNSEAREFLKRVGLDVPPSLPTHRLPFAKRQMVEIAKALAAGRSGERESLIALDEPTAVLGASDIDVLYAEVQRLRTWGAVIFISHRLDEVMRFADRIYVLRDGKVVAERDASKVEEQELRLLMLGRPSSSEFYLESAQRPRSEVLAGTGAPRLRVAHLSKRGSFDDVSFDVHAGEILGLLGGVGAGCEDIVRAVFGATPADGGSIEVDGARFQPRSPRQAIRRGVCYVPAERRTEGQLAGLTVAENMLAANGQLGTRGPLVSRRRRHEVVREQIQLFGVRPDDPRLDIAKLSGGNAQKVVLAKWLLLGDKLRVLLLDHPTRGLDVGAKEALYGIFRRLSDTGVATVLVADTIDEAVGMSHKLLVMRDGRVSGDFDASPGQKPNRTDVVGRMV